MGGREQIKDRRSGSGGNHVDSLQNHKERQEPDRQIELLSLIQLSHDTNHGNSGTHREVALCLLTHCQASPVCTGTSTATRIQRLVRCESNLREHSRIPNPGTVQKSESGQSMLSGCFEREREGDPNE